MAMKQLPTPQPPGPDLDAWKTPLRGSKLTVVQQYRKQFERDDSYRLSPPKVAKLDAPAAMTGPAWMEQKPSPLAQSQTLIGSPEQQQALKEQTEELSKPFKYGPSRRPGSTTIARERSKAAMRKELRDRACKGRKDAAAAPAGSVGKRPVKPLTASSFRSDAGEIELMIAGTRCIQNFAGEWVTEDGQPCPIPAWSAAAAASAEVAEF